MKKYSLLLAVVWTLLIVVGSLMSGKSLNSAGLFHIPNLDKLIHAASYFLFVFLWSMALVKSKTQKTVIQIVATGIVLGLAVEFAQKLLTTDRHFENLDIIANIIGSIGGGIAFNWLTKTTKDV